MCTKLLLVVLSLIAVVCAQTLSKTGDFSIYSPLYDGIYVAGQALPITYIVLDQGAKLNIYLTPDVGVSNPGLQVVQNADVTSTAGAVVTMNGKTYWQHTYNYIIPNNVHAGKWDVVFESEEMKTNTSIPVQIQPYVNMTTASPSTSASAANATGTTSSSKSMAVKHAPVAMIVSTVLTFMISALLF